MAVTVHEGQSYNSGHYWSVIKQDDGSWFKFDDERVSWPALEIQQQVFLLLSLGAN